MPTKILNECELTFDVLTKCVYKSIETGYFPDSPKLANVAPVFKKEDPLDKSNYQPVIVLHLLSKVYEKVIYNQLSGYFNSFLNKTHNTQHALFKLLQSWPQVLDNEGLIGTVLMDLSKDCIPHNLLIAKLECYGADKASLRLLLDYLTRRKQRAKIGSSFSSWCDMKTGVLQESIIVPLLFNIFINYLFFSIKKSEVCNFADNDTFFYDGKNLDLAFFNLSIGLSNVMDCFKMNSIKANPGKFQFIVLGANKNDSFNLNVAGEVIPSSSEVKLVGITIDYERIS